MNREFQIKVESNNESEQKQTLTLIAETFRSEYFAQLNYIWMLEFFPQINNTHAFGWLYSKTCQHIKQNKNEIVHTCKKIEFLMPTFRH